MSLINKIYIHATAETSEPSYPNLGSNVSSWSGTKKIGSVQMFTDDADLESDDVGMPIETVIQTVRSARALAPTELKMISRMVQPFPIMTKHTDADLLALDSAYTITSNAGQLVSTVTARTLGIEIDGKAFIYFPKVYLFMSSISAGYGEDGVAKTEIMVHPIATSSVPGGFKLTHYVAA